MSRNLPLGGAKQMLLEGGIRVPFILHWPDVLPKGKEYSTPVNAYDLTATVAATGGAKPQKDKPFDGVDLIPVLTGKSELAYDRPQFFRRRNIRVRANQNQIRQSAVRQGEWKYLRTYKPVGSDKYQVALYNLKKDLGETKNLAAESPDKVKAMSDLLNQWEKEMDKTAEPFEKFDSPAKPKKSKK